MASLNIAIQIHIDDREFRRMMNQQRFVPVFNKHMSQQFLSVGERAKYFIRKSIDEGGFAPLGVWQYIKGHDTVLINTRSLGDGFTFKFFKQAQGAVVGIRVMPTGQHPSGLSMTKIAEIMQSGTSFTPTLAQRQAVAIKASAAGAPPPEGQKKEVWTIPPRPFMQRAILSDVFINDLQRRVQRTLYLVFSELKRG